MFHLLYELKSTEKFLVIEIESTKSTYSITSFNLEPLCFKNCSDISILGKSLEPFPNASKILVSISSINLRISIIFGKVLSAYKILPYLSRIYYLDDLIWFLQSICLHLNLKIHCFLVICFLFELFIYIQNFS